MLISYCMGEHAVRLVRALRRDQQLILDCYVPIFTEVSARDSADPIREQAEYVRDVRFWTEPLTRGDFFLCATAPRSVTTAACSRRWDGSIR